jgi:hypothetical protein
MTRCISSTTDSTIRFSIENRSRHLCDIVIHWCNKAASVVTDHGGDDGRKYPNKNFCTILSGIPLVPAGAGE